MKTSGIYLFEILTLLAWLTSSNADVDCYKHPPRINLENCCQISDFVTEEIKTKCMSEVFSDMPAPGEENFREYFGPPKHPKHHGGPHGHGPHHHCFISCVLNETGILTDNEFQDDNMIAYLNTIYDDSEIVDFIGEQFRKCNEKRESLPEKKPQRQHGQHCPHDHGHMLIGCTYIHAFKNCPDFLWSNTNECNAIREHFRECTPPHHQITDAEEIEEEPIEVDDVNEEKEVEI